jgi:hypothetical protein
VIERILKPSSDLMRANLLGGEERDTIKWAKFEFGDGTSAVFTRDATRGETAKNWQKDGQPWKGGAGLSRWIDLLSTRIIQQYASSVAVPKSGPKGLKSLQVQLGTSEKETLFTGRFGTAGGATLVGFGKDQKEAARITPTLASQIPWTINVLEAEPKKEEKAKDEQDLDHTGHSH